MDFIRYCPHLPFPPPFIRNLFSPHQVYTFFIQPKSLHHISPLKTALVLKNSEEVSCWCLVISWRCPLPDGGMWASICESNWGRTEVSLVLALSSPSIESSLPCSHNCVFFPLFLSNILMAAVACNYVAIICFLASNWCSIAVLQS